MQYLPHGYLVDVSATNLSCRKARAIEREFWLGPRRRKVLVNGGSGYDGYTLLKRYPGYRCNFGAGGGGCQKGNKIAGASVRVNGS